MSLTIEVGNTFIAPGECKRLELPVARLPTETWVSLPISVINGRHDGAQLWLSAAVHGDELNGMEIINRVLEQIDPKTLRGAIIAAPIVNVFGFINQSRYLPDRRDLNRCFPGSKNGSLASRLANLFITEVVKKCTHGIDLHTGSNHRTNLPQIRANLDDEETARCAKAFGASVMINSNTRDGSLREAAAKLGIPVLLYEAGEAMRFEEEAISVGVRGVLRVMGSLGMIKRKKPRKNAAPPLISHESSWIRARCSGILRLVIQLGDSVTKGQVIGTIGNALGDDKHSIRAAFTGLIIGVTNNPLVNRGDSLVHVAKIAPAAEASFDS
ncbi:MAG: succinylglutamate desuccinylase/aspartoacylase family protein [bacterium]|nr:succinylglutamate desuccinylase/aspartoacylase family protein [bacterium]